jgi:hypothetical protein
MKEIWKPVPGFEGLYEVSTEGAVRSLPGKKTHSKGRTLRLTANSYGYLVVGLRKDGKAKQFTVHRLVAMTFIPNPLELPQVNHKDEDKTNNHVENLEWCDAKYNCNWGTWRERDTRSHIGERNPMYGVRGEKHPCFGKHPSEETRKKMSLSHIGIQKGEEHPLWGKHHSEESRRKMSEAQKRYYAQLKQQKENAE